MRGTHLCLVCNNTGKVFKDNCPLCSRSWASDRSDFWDTIRKTLTPSDTLSYDPTNMDDFDRGWDLDESNNSLANLSESLFRVKDGKVVG